MTSASCMVLFPLPSPSIVYPIYLTCVCVCVYGLWRGWIWGNQADERMTESLREWTKQKGNRNRSRARIVSDVVRKGRKEKKLNRTHQKESIIERDWPIAGSCRVTECECVWKRPVMTDSRGTQQQQQLSNKRSKRIRDHCTLLSCLWSPFLSFFSFSRSREATQFCVRVCPFRYFSSTPILWRPFFVLFPSNVVRHLCSGTDRPRTPPTPKRLNTI